MGVIKKRMKLFKAIFTLLMLMLAPLSYAGDTASTEPSSAPTTVVELFTSQGCSSCPAANEFVGEMADDTDKLVLSYGVTYWDYLGWKDSFARPENTVRQRAYARAFGIGNVYTPQIVLNGSAHSPRYTKHDIESMPMATTDVKLDLSAKDGRLVLHSNAPTVVVSFKPGWQAVAVKAGENRGETLRLANAVTAMTRVTNADDLDISVETGMAYAALVHDPKTRKVITASVYTTP